MAAWTEADALVEETGTVEHPHATMLRKAKLGREIESKLNIAGKQLSKP